MTRVFKNPGPGKPAATPPAAAPRNQQFHAVEIHCGSACCAAVQALKEKRFLSRRAPPILPLQDCSKPAGCTCRYVHHDDRRDESRREADTGIWDTTRLESANNRRSSRGRRTAD
jgi:hypothetical protein